MAHESQGDDLHRQQEPARGNEAVCAQRQQGSAAGCGPEARMDAHIASLAVGISALISAWHWPHVRLYRPAAVPFVELSAELFSPPTPKSSNNEPVASCSSDAFSPHGMTASHDSAAPPRRRLLPPAASALDESTSGL